MVRQWYDRILLQVPADSKPDQEKRRFFRWITTRRYPIHKIILVFFNIFNFTVFVKQLSLLLNIVLFREFEVNLKFERKAAGRIHKLDYFVNFELWYE